MANHKFGSAFVLKAVQTQLQARALEQPSLATVLEQIGQNAGFLEHLLLLEYFHCIIEEDDGTSGDETRGDDPPETKQTEALQDEEAMAIVASERLVSVLKKIEGAYESLLNLMPPRDEPSASFNGRRKRDVLSCRRRRCLQDDNVRGVFYFDEGAMVLKKAEGAMAPLELYGKPQVERKRACGEERGRKSNRVIDSIQSNRFNQRFCL